MGWLGYTAHRLANSGVIRKGPHSMNGLVGIRAFLGTAGTDRQAKHASTGCSRSGCISRCLTFSGRGGLRQWLQRLHPTVGLRGIGSTPHPGDRWALRSASRSRRLLRRIPLFAGAAIAGSGLTLLVACDFDRVRTAAVVASVPRTAWAVSWGMRTGLAYARCMAAHTDHSTEAYQADLSLLHKASARRLRQLCQSNAGIYIKAAQLMSTAQAIPQEYRKRLEVLQDRAEPRDFEEVQLAVLQQLGAPIEELFAEFEPEARAAASLAQVHKARLFDGREVAVKVQYVGLETAVTADFTTLTILANAAAKWFPNSLDFGWILEELKQNLAKELDFRLEARNAERLSSCMAGLRRVAIPKPVPQLSGERIITMEWMDGCKLTDLEGLRDQHLHSRDVAIELLQAFAKMTFVDGFVHGDPHARNIMVRPHPEPQSFWYRWFGGGWQEPQLVLLDHGLIVEIPDTLRQQYCQLWCSFILNDQVAAKAIATCIAGEKGGELIPKLVRPGALKNEDQRRALRDQAGVKSLGDLGRLLEGLPRPFVDFLKVQAIIRGAATKLGSSLHDRLRINATYAQKGMSIARSPGERLGYEGSMQSRAQRLRITISIAALRSIWWLGSTAICLWHNVTSVLLGTDAYALHPA